MTTEVKTAFDWGAAEPRARDYWIAENLMGWERVPVDSSIVAYQYRVPGKTFLYWPPCVPAYGSDIKADNEVREAMRGKGSATVEKFYDALWRVLHDRWTCSDECQTSDFDTTMLYPMNFYEVGDYSHAAYLALNGS